MIVLNLACSHDHLFEGWFGSAHDFETQLTRGQLSCPLCADTSIRRMPTAARLNVSKLREETHRASDASGRKAAEPSAAKPSQASASDPGAVAPIAPAAAAAQGATQPNVQPSAQQIQALVLHAVRELMAKTEDVGGQFAEEARRIHYGEAEDRAIRGQTSAEELEALSDEGIEVLALPLPPPLAGTLQ
ncbi:DUF1178 family protein [Paucibacter sp. Y2R2-4]|uniref:DUF1178 family protein n=1 Tax=Paucibacter sp. Y2R2-4 TaxID=2893553 RepID=UPI0021E49F20|nr:DUF1178 family protein [Paucibacter sp. Y2R2-4]MCV2348361.1 DUF1178 family protein [Paucibacter sp. Y2R2-4]